MFHVKHSESGMDNYYTRRAKHVLFTLSLRVITTRMKRRQRTAGRFVPPNKIIIIE